MIDLHFVFVKETERETWESGYEEGCFDTDSENEEEEGTSL